MSRTVARKGPTPSPAPAKADAPPRRKEGWRETVESLAVAFILALLIRGFEAEAFVIPTGSMAPTLMGRHKEVTCPECGLAYAVNASDEVEGLAGARPSARWVARGTCVNCRYTADIGDLPSFKGDRILVTKFLYDLPRLPLASRPRRWDVIVFKYPEDPETNYIKRLVGLPDEELRVLRGDILTRPRVGPPDAPFALQRKPLFHQRAMQIVVYDDAHRPRSLADDPRWRRWAPGASGGWSESATEPGTFTSDVGSGTEWLDLRYRHLVPEPDQWDAVLDHQPLPREPRPTLITDFYSYNTNQSADSFAGDGAILQPHWVGDLTLAARVQVRQPGGTLRLELIEGGVANHCEVDLRTGQATLLHDGKALGSAPTRMNGPGTYDLGFANVDDRLTLTVDGSAPAGFGDGLIYEDDRTSRPTAADLDPVGIATRGASVAVSGLVLSRDIYYTQTPGGADYSDPWEPGRYSGGPTERARASFDLLADPARYAELRSVEPRDYPIKPGHYMMMGDNSPKSKDGRGWGQADRYNAELDIGWDTSDRASWEVPEALLIGKAFFVYWPHGKPFGPDIRLNRDFRVPFRPYFERMKWIR